MPSRQDPRVLPKVSERTRTQRSCAGTARKKAIELAIAARNRKTTTEDGRRVRRKGDSEGKGNKKKFMGKCCKCGKTGHMSKDCRSPKTSAFEAGGEGLVETKCSDMASVPESDDAGGAWSTLKRPVRYLVDDRRIVKVISERGHRQRLRGMQMCVDLIFVDGCHQLCCEQLCFDWFGLACS